MMYFIATRLQADPKGAGKAQYENLTNAISALGPSSDRLDRCWLVESKLSAGRIRSLLKPHLLDGDRVFVGQFTGNWAGFAMGPKFPEWIKRRDFSTPS